MVTCWTCIYDWVSPSTETTSKSMDVVLMGSGKPRHPMRNSRLLFLLRRLSFTFINEVLRLVPLGLLKYVHTGVYRSLIVVDFTPADVDVSLKDFPPVSSEIVLPFLPLSPSPVFVLSFLFTIFARGIEILVIKKQKSSPIFTV